MSKILIVDDQKSVLSTVTKGLKTCEEEMEVKTALNGEQAIEILNASKVDLVLTALKMPVMDGFKLLSFMKSHFKNIPAIVMTDSGSSAYKPRLERLGVLHYLEKPFPLKVLQENILGVLHNRNNDYLSSFSLSNFLQMVKSDEKTLTLKIISNDMFGYMHFDNGDLIDAKVGNLIGMNAAVKMLGWDEAKIEIQGLATKKRRIHTSIINILLEASSAKD